MRAGASSGGLKGLGPLAESWPQASCQQGAGQADTSVGGGQSPGLQAEHPAQVCAHSPALSGGQAPQVTLCSG